MSRYTTAWAHCPWEMDSETPGFTVENHTQTIYLQNNLAGKSLRIKFSNLYGWQPLVFSCVTVACCGRAAKRVTLNGEPCITVPPGIEVYSDEITMEIVAGEWITLSTHIEGARQVRGFVMPFSPELARVERKGRASSPFPMLEAIPEGLVYFYGISAIEVKTEADAKVLAMFGDSITHMGAIAGPLVRRLYELLPGRLGFKNAGITGNRLLRNASKALPMGEWFGQSGVSRFEKDVFTGDNVDVVLILEGINDICHPVMMGSLDELPTVQALTEGLTRCASIAHNNNAAVLACTLPPFGGYEYWIPKLEKLREGYNDWIRTSSVLDGVLDLAVLLADTEDTRRMPERLHTGDGLHPSKEAGQLLAENVALSILRDLLTA